MALFRSWDQGLIPVGSPRFDIAAASRRTTYAHSLDLALIFTAKGLRPFPIEFFAPERLAAAQDWLAAR